MKQAFIAIVVALSAGACSAKKEDEYRSPDSVSVSYQTAEGLDVVLKDDSHRRVSLCSTGQERLEHDLTLAKLKTEVLRIGDVTEFHFGPKTVKYVAGYPVWGPHTTWSPDVPFPQECISFGYGKGVGDIFVIYGEEKPSHYNGYLEWKP